jgi:hypothetical protein
VGGNIKDYAADGVLRKDRPPDGSVALVPHLQARLLARSLRGDLAPYLNLYLGNPGFCCLFRERGLGLMSVGCARALNGASHQRR